MGKIFFSFKKEHKFIIYMGILQIINLFTTLIKNILSEKRNSSIIVFAGLFPVPYEYHST